MGALFGAIGSVFKFHKLKIFFIVVFAAVFGVLTFPYGDLSGILPTVIYEKTGNQIYVQFEDFGLNLFPLGLSMDEVLAEIPGRAPIEAAHVDASPWILGAVTGKMGASIDAQELFGGAIVADYREGDKAKSGNRFANVAVDAQGLKLPLITEFLRNSGMASFSLVGAANISTQLQIDAMFKDQPSGDIEATFTGLTVPAQVFNVQVQGGVMQNPIPEVKVGPAKLSAKMSAGRLDITELSFGSSKDSVAGRIKGNIALQVLKDQLGTRPQMGEMDLVVDLTMKKAFLDSDKSLQLATLLIAQFGREVADGTRYQFRMKMAPGMPLPQFSAVQ
ncbi:MAG: type II secretion system protein GspN [Bdellovibrionota bacterium]